jgi:hypothetical protein
MECIGCFSIIVPAPIPQDTHIGITLSSPIGSRFSPYDHPFTVIYFARLEEDQDSFVSKFPLVPSNAKSGNRFYLLNAPPGRYVAVAGFAPLVKGQPSSGIPGSSNFNVGSAGTLGYYVAFSKPLVALTEVKAEPGRLAFMGNFLVTTHQSMFATHQRLSEPPRDEVQTDTIDHKLPVSLTYLGSIDEVKQGSDIEQRFFLKAKGDLGEPGWGIIIQEALESLGKR